MTSVKGTKGGTKASQSKGNGKHFRPDDKRLKSKRWKVCPKCGKELCHSGSAMCWRDRGLGDPASISGVDAHGVPRNPYAKFLYEKEKASKAKARVKGTKARIADTMVP